MIDLEKMAKEHEKLFPKATLESQVWKLEEEINEVENTFDREQIREECVDIFIVCGGLYRWCPSLAENVAEYFELFFDGLGGEQWDTESKAADIERKWQINLKRKWEWNGKTYHHVEEVLK